MLASGRCRRANPGCRSVLAPSRAPFQTGRRPGHQRAFHLHPQSGPSSGISRRPSPLLPWLRARGSGGTAARPLLLFGEVSGFCFPEPWDGDEICAALGSEKIVPSPRLGSGSERLLPGRKRVSALGGPGGRGGVALRLGGSEAGRPHHRQRYGAALYLEPSFCGRRSLTVSLRMGYRSASASSLFPGASLSFHRVS